MPDSPIARRIRAALEQAEDVDLHHNRIELQVGEVIRLEGEVDNIAVKRRARQIAQAIAGSTPVEDRLMLRVETRRGDDQLRQAELEALMTEPAFRDYAVGERADGPPDDGEERYGIAVEVSASRVRLHGRANSPSHRRLAEVIAWWVPGTADVENRIRVHPPRQDNDEELSEIIRLVLDKDPTLDASAIQVIARDQEITLKGVVGSDVKRKLAAYDCWYVPGVHRVHNQLQVRPPG